VCACVYLVTHAYDLDIEHMTLTLDLDLDVLMMYLLTRNEVCSVRLSRVRAEQDRQTMDRRDRTYYHIFNILTPLKRFSNVSTVVC